MPPVGPYDERGADHQRPLRRPRADTHDTPSLADEVDGLGATQPPKGGILPRFLSQEVEEASLGHEGNVRAAHP